jgi:hypothetical protein
MYVPVSRDHTRSWPSGAGVVTLHDFKGYLRTCLLNCSMWLLVQGVHRTPVSVCEPEIVFRLGWTGKGCHSESLDRTRVAAPPALVNDA